MPRPKPTPATKSGSKYTLEELKARYDHDPAEALFKMITEDLPFPVDGDGEVLKDVLDSLLESHEIYLNEKKEKRLRLKSRLRVDINTDLMQYYNPKLRGAEVRGQIDHNFTINIQTFEEPKKIAATVERRVIDTVVVPDDTNSTGA